MIDKLASIICCRKLGDDSNSSQDTQEMATPDKKAKELFYENQLRKDVEFTAVSHLVVDALQALNLYEKDKEQEQE